MVLKNQSATGSITGSATAKTTEKSSSDYYIPVAKTSYSSALPSGMTEAQFTDISALGHIINIRANIKNDIITCIP